MAYGTDLLGGMHRRQSEEFTIRSRVLPVQEVIASATAVAAQVVGMKDKLGVIAPDAFADLVVVDGDPLKDIGVLTGQGDRMLAIMKGGAFVKNTLN
jgi:imidazolonepropionase-like amidohydrolase